MNDLNKIMLCHGGLFGVPVPIHPALSQWHFSSGASKYERKGKGSASKVKPGGPGKLWISLLLTMDELIKNESVSPPRTKGQCLVISAVQRLHKAKAILLKKRWLSWAGKLCTDHKQSLVSLLSSSAHVNRHSECIAVTGRAVHHSHPVETLPLLDQGNWAHSYLTPERVCEVGAEGIWKRSTQASSSSEHLHRRMPTHALSLLQCKCKPSAHNWAAPLYL